MVGLGRFLTMKAAGMPKHRPIGFAISMLIIVCAVSAGAYVVLKKRPATDDATIDADVVHVAAAVGGRIVELPVHENDLVRKGDLLFQIDRVPYQLAVRLAAANLEVARAALDTKKRFVATQKSNAAIAGAQVRRAETNYGLAQRTEERLRPLTGKGYVPLQQLDQAQAATHDATTSLRQAEEQRLAAGRAIDTIAGAEAAVQAAEAALGQARRALEDTTVRAEHEGRIVGLTVLTGELVLPSQALFTLVGTDEWFAVANFRETELREISSGDCATVYSLIDPNKPLKGVVQGIGWGVLAADKINLPRSVPYVQPSLNWVRVAQRFPVRIRLEHPAESLVRLGASATVELKHGAACR